MKNLKTQKILNLAMPSLLSMSAVFGLASMAEAAVFNFSYSSSGATFEDTPSRATPIGDGLNASGTITLSDSIGDGSSFTTSDVTDYSIDVFNGTTLLFTFTQANSGDFAGAGISPTTFNGTRNGNSLNFTQFITATASNIFGCSLIDFCPTNPFGDNLVIYDDDASIFGNGVTFSPDATVLTYSYPSGDALLSSFQATIAATTAVPEPTTLGLIIGTGVLLLSSQKKKH